MGKPNKSAKPTGEPAPEQAEPTTWAARFASLDTRRLFGETWAAADERAAAEKARRKAEGLGTDWRPFWAMVLAGCILTFLRYTGVTEGYIRFMADGDTDAARQAVMAAPDFLFDSKVWWSGWRIVGYILVPALFIKFVMKEKVTDYGLSLKGVKDHAWIYGLGFGIVVIAVFFVSFDTAFQNKYPMYENAGRSYRDLLMWELIYAAQFFALEFFFRGYWLKTCERVMGGHAVTCMVVPYCMIHFGKPWPETIGAIFAGLILGTLVLRYRSIWAGVVVHVSVAVSMDVLSLWQKGQLPSVW